VNVLGAAREALAAEVRQVQLEADDVLRNIRTGVITVDADGHLLYANPASEEILGFKAREWLGRSVMPEFARLAPEFWAAVTSTARRGVRLMRVEATVHRPDHSFPIGVTTTTLDAPVGARPRVTECRPMDLHLVAEAAIRLVRQHPDCAAGVKITLEGGPTPMEGDEDLLHRVVSNLVLNAVQAAGARAAVKVRTGLAAANELPGAAGIENPVALRVSDNGPGIPAELQDRLFEPFATGRVGGTGLGLAIVQRAVEAHRGLVLVDTKAGGGTT